MKYIARVPHARCFCIIIIFFKGENNKRKRALMIYKVNLFRLCVDDFS